MNSTVKAGGNAALELDLLWQGEIASHRDTLFARASLWADIFPKGLAEDLVGLQKGDRLEVELKGSDLIPRDPELVADFKSNEFAGGSITPRAGRFYPRGLLAASGRSYGPPALPFRCLAATDQGFKADLNHPIAGREQLLIAAVAEPEISSREISGASVDWMEALRLGPGMQDPMPGLAEGFAAAGGLGRADERPDRDFYQQPRLVGHIDSLASFQISVLYGRLLPRGAKVLDLMSSYQSHLPRVPDFAEVVGLGLNSQEMQSNPVLSRNLVHDLNLDPSPPFEDASFDGVICSVSVEYLTRPLEVFAQVRRVLRPGGVFIVSFSNRFFPPKVVEGWRELHDFERMGLVADYFREAGGYTRLATRSLRGWPRPTDDAHYPEQKMADPVYAVWGYAN